MLSRGMNRKLDKGKGVSMKRVNKRRNRQFPDRAPLPTNVKQSSLRDIISQGTARFLGRTA
jgi:hypothetical protein